MCKSICVYVCMYVYTSYIHIYTFSGRLALGVLDHSRVVPFIIYYLPYTIVPPHQDGPGAKTW